MHASRSSVAQPTHTVSAPSVHVPDGNGSPSGGEQIRVAIFESGGRDNVTGDKGKGVLSHGRVTRGVTGQWLGVRKMRHVDANRTAIECMVGSMSKMHEDLSGRKPSC